MLLFSETTSKMAVSLRRRQAACRFCVRHKGGGRLHQVQTLKQTPTYLRQAQLRSGRRLAKSSAHFCVLWFTGKRFSSRRHVRVTAWRPGRRFDKVLTRCWFADVLCCCSAALCEALHFHLWRIYCWIASHFIDSLSAHRLVHLSK